MWTTDGPVRLQGGEALRVGLSWYQRESQVSRGSSFQSVYTNSERIAPAFVSSLSPRTVRAPREKRRPLFLASEEGKETSSCTQQPTTKEDKPKTAEPWPTVLSLMLSVGST